MTDHLPECQYASGRAVRPDWPCICDRLRACEQRVLLSKPNIELSAVYGYEAGRADGLSAARDAVAALPYGSPLDDALAAIDALKGGADAPSTDTGSTG